MQAGPAHFPRSPPHFFGFAFLALASAAFRAFFASPSAFFAAASPASAAS